MERLLVYKLGASMNIAVSLILGSEQDPVGGYIVHDSRIKSCEKYPINLNFHDIDPCSG
jgi:hypothetical protein